MKKTELRNLSVSNLVTLKRNPQYLTPSQMDRLKASMMLDGFCAPILVRPVEDGRFEIVSGNHRFMAAVELGMREVPCVVSELDQESAKRLAINLNTIHGTPNAEILAPFLCEMEEATLGGVFISEDMKQTLLDFDGELKGKLAKLAAPSAVDRDSPNHDNERCTCNLCGRKHLKPKVPVCSGV